MESTNDTGGPLGTGQLVTCRLDELRPHSSYVRHHLTVSASRLSALAERGDRAFVEPLMITRDRTILDGYGRWELARLQGRATLPCIEFDLTESEALQWLIQKHRRSNGLNDFSRILLALELEPWFRENARSNQRAGGQNKGSSNLTEASRLDVRSEIARAAGVSVGNVSKVKQLTLSADPNCCRHLREWRDQHPSGVAVVQEITGKTARRIEGLSERERHKKDHKVARFAASVEGLTCRPRSCPPGRPTLGDRFQHAWSGQRGSY